jgi:hypothetical protein
MVTYIVTITLLMQLKSAAEGQNVSSFAPVFKGERKQGCFK